MSCRAGSGATEPRGCRAIVMAMLSRRQVLLAPVAATLARVVSAQSAAPGKMLLAIHQNTSRGAGFRGSLEGLGQSRNPVCRTERAAPDGFLETDTLPAARRLLSDLDLTPVSAAAALPDLWIPGPARAATLESWKRRCDQFATLGLTKIYSPSITNRPVTADDFAATPDCIREAGEIAREYDLTAMIRVPPHVDPSGHPDVGAGDDSCGGAPQRPAHARLLPLLVGSEQVPGSGSARAGRARTCSFSGSARHAP